MNMCILFIYILLFLDFFWIIFKVIGIINIRFLNLNLSFSFLILGFLYCVFVVYIVVVEYNWDLY